MSFILSNLWIILVVVFLLVVIAFVLSSRKRRSKRDKLIKKAITSEIARAERFSSRVGILILEVRESVPRGVHYLVPGVTMNVEHISKHLRKYDTVLKVRRRRYTLLLPEAETMDAPSIVKKRIEKIAEENKWGDVNIGIATYPEDGETPEELLRKAYYDAREKT